MGSVGPYADVLMDRWFKRTFGWAPAKRLLQLFLQELIPERKIVDLSYGPQEHVNPVDEGKDVRMDVGVYGPGWEPVRCRDAVGGASGVL